MTLRERDAPLQDFHDFFALPTLTTPDAPLLQIVANMQEYPEVRWHIVRQHQQIEGLIPPLIGTVASSLDAALQSQASYFGIRGPFSTLAGPIVASCSEASALQH